MDTPPQQGTPERTWWSAGAYAEAAARNAGRSEAGLKVRSFVDALAKHDHDKDARAIAKTIFSVYVLAGQSLTKRLLLALWVLRGGG